MKRVHMLLALLVVLSGGAGVLYNQGYWDTWTDKKDQVKTEIFADLEGVPENAKEPFTECLALGVVELATQLECELADGPLIPQFVTCVNAAGEGQSVGLLLMGCVVQVQADLNDGRYVQPQETP